MKKTILFFLLMCVSLSHAQWSLVSGELGDAPVTSMFAFVDTIMAGTDGAGLFKSTNNGASWTDISGTIGNKNINQIHGAAGPRVICAGTDGGAFFTQDHITYEDNTATFTPKDINFYWTGGSTGEKDWFIGTNGAGLFVSGERSGPWVAANNGISGDGLIINDLGDYSDNEVDYAVMATDGGVYFSTDNFVTWTQKNNGLTGEALKVKKLTGLGKFIIIATHSGLYYTLNFGDNYTALIPDEIFNTVFIIQSTLSSTGFLVFAFGEHGYFSQDFLNYSPMTMPTVPPFLEKTNTENNMKTAIKGSIPQVISATTNSSNLFIGYQSGGLYRKPLDSVVPVELSSFHALAKSNHVVLQWETQTETNNHGFEIQRLISTQIGWEKIGYVKGHGTTTEQQRYEFVDYSIDKISGEAVVQYRLKQIDTDGTFQLSSVQTVSLNNPQKARLAQNYPNPFNPTTTIAYDLTAPGNIQLAIYDMLGRHIRTLVDSHQQAGHYETTWDGADSQNIPVPTGLYLCRMKIRNQATSDKDHQESTAYDFEKVIKLALMR